MVFNVYEKNTKMREVMQTTDFPGLVLNPVPRFEVQKRCPFRGWQTCGIYYEKQHADEECFFRISKSPLEDKNSWRVFPE